MANIQRCICGKVITVDIADDLKADTITDIKNIPMEDASLDVVCSFQVLEHIPWSEVQDALGEMMRVSKKYVLFSVPDNKAMKEPAFSIKIPFLNRSVGYSSEKNRYKGISNIKEHYLEIGINGATVNSVEKIIKKSFFTLFDNWLDGVDRYFLCEDRKK